MELSRATVLKWGELLKKIPITELYGTNMTKKSLSYHLKRFHINILMFYFALTYETTIFINCKLYHYCKQKIEINV